MSYATQEKIGAYSSNQRAQIDGRQIDAQALLNCAGKLKAAIDDGGKDKVAYMQAIQLNQRLWTVFQVALCDAENQLPANLKSTLLNLSRYVDRVSFRAIGNFAPQLLNSLIDINRAIAAGLNKKPQQAAPAAQPSADAVPTTSLATPAVLMTSA
jgi:flagellar protein FlaF